MIVITGNKCQCALCGSVFELPAADELPSPSFEAGSRVLRVQGVEVHRCPERSVS